MPRTAARAGGAGASGRTGASAAPASGRRWLICSGFALEVMGPGETLRASGHPFGYPAHIHERVRGAKVAAFVRGPLLIRGRSATASVAEHTHLGARGYA